MFFQKVGLLPQCENRVQWAIHNSNELQCKLVYIFFPKVIDNMRVNWIMEVKEEIV